MCVFRNYKGIYYYEVLIHILHPTALMYLNSFFTSLNDANYRFSHPTLSSKLIIYLELTFRTPPPLMEQDDWVEDSGEGGMP